MTHAETKRLDRDLLQIINGGENMKQEDQDRIIKIVSNTFDKYAEELQKNVHLSARIAELEIELAGHQHRERVLHEIRVEQGGL